MQVGLNVFITAHLFSYCLLQGLSKKLCLLVKSQGRSVSENDEQIPNPTEWQDKFAAH